MLSFSVPVEKEAPVITAEESAAEEQVPSSLENPESSELNALASPPLRQSSGKRNAYHTKL